MKDRMTNKVHVLRATLMGEPNYLQYPPIWLTFYKDQVYLNHNKDNSA